MTDFLKTFLDSFKWWLEKEQRETSGENSSSTVVGRDAMRREERIGGKNQKVSKELI